MSKTYMRAPSGEVFQTSNPEYHKECENLGNGTKGFAARQEYARKCLREFIKPGTTVYCNLLSVSRTGMGRRISFYVVHKGRIRTIDNLMSDACGIQHHKDGGLYFGGCGMDMGFSGVYSLGRALWPNGTRKPHGMRNGEPDKDGGYALKYEWL